MKTAKYLTAAMAAAGLLAMAAPALAQDQETQHRLDKIEKDLHEIRSIVLQARATGQPVEVRSASSDEEMAAMQSRLDDIDQRLRDLTGQIEVATHNQDMAKQDLADAQAKIAALSDRVDKLEQQAAPPAPAPTANDAGSTGGSDQAQGAPGDANAAYVQARRTLLNGDYQAAGDALQNFLSTYPNSPNVPAAHYWLGEVKYTQNDYAAAASNLVDAIRGWPKTPWAPDAMVKLSLSLSQLNKTKDACATLAALPRHYPKLTAAARTRVADARAKAGCSG
ncbi:MAG: tol-pal system protein YbgF [Caulobacteraceae bacterium]|nr:tol-pal system protein YbgF [Caulobacteraceae bacterium]